MSSFSPRAPFVLYAGYHADNSYVPLTHLAWSEEDYLPKSPQGVPLAQHGDIFDSRLMQQVADIVCRPWNLSLVTEMWVSTIPGTKEVAISLLVPGKRPANYPLAGEESKRVVDLVNSWKEETLT